MDIGGKQMEDGEYDEVLQVIIKDKNLKNFIDPNLAEMLSKEFGDFKVLGLSIIVGEADSNENMITLMHKNPSFIKENKLIIDAENEINLKKMHEISRKLK